MNRKRIENGPQKYEDIFKEKNNQNAKTQKANGNEPHQFQKWTNGTGKEKDREDQILSKLNVESELEQNQNENDDSKDLRYISNSSKKVKRSHRRL